MRSPATAPMNCRQRGISFRGKGASRTPWNGLSTHFGTGRIGRAAPVLIQLDGRQSEGRGPMKALRLTTTAALLIIFGGVASAQTTLRIGLGEDPDILDPTLARTYVGRIVFASFCDKLFDIDEKLSIVPQ